MRRLVERARWKRAARVAVVVMLWVVAICGMARGEAAERVVVRMVTGEGKLISDLEALRPVVRTIFDEKGTKTITVGERATLWVRNANVDGKFTFERFHQGKYINRSAELGIDAAELGVGRHVINPGAHAFVLQADGALRSDDPEITIDGRTVSLRVHKMEVLGVDGARRGPPEYRLVGAKFGLLALDAKTKIDARNLPDPKTLTNVLSHGRTFYPLAVYLPSNTVGEGYVLYPSWQTFQVARDGRVSLGAQRVPGIEAAGGRIVVPYRKFRGRVNTSTGLSSGVGSVPLSAEMLYSPTLEDLRFVAGMGKPAEGFFLRVDNDLSKRPNKFFLADNTTKDPKAIRMLALEWDRPVYERGSTQTVALRFLQSADKSTVRQPAVRMAFSVYNPSSPDRRDWTDVGPVKWADGQLSFPVPDVDYNFYMFRAMILDAGSKDSWSPLSGEWPACIVRKGQTGTASFISNKGRNAFVIGEDIELAVVVRSREARRPGEREIVLHGPDGRVERTTFADDGSKWMSRAFRITAASSGLMAPGHYALTVEGLPADVAPFAFRFDLAGDQKTSLYYIVKPSKYTKAMNDLVPSQIGHKGMEAVNLDRAVATLAEMGYNRIDLMTYITDHHIRPHAWREGLAEADERLMAPASVYTPSPRDQILNACVRNRIEFSDVFLSYNDFHIPRYIEGYTEASKRWIKREMASMRHSPALAGMMLYDEMYDTAVTGLVASHQKLFPRIREERAAKELGIAPAQIKSAMARYVARPKNQRDPEALRNFLRYGRWERHGWGDWNTRVADAAREVAPGAKIGTYHRTWMTPGNATGIINGWPPDVFEPLDITSHVHYADNITGWVHSSMMASALRFGRRRPLWVNIPLMHGVRGHLNGEYEKHMAFAMLMEGADGVSQYGLPATFENGPNPETVAGKESTEILNREILAPLGEIVSRTEPGYRNVGIVSTENQHLLNEYKPIGVSHQTEELWLACWRLGYPATFLYDDAFRRSVSDFQLIFVPGVRFEGELEPFIVERLKEAIAAGTKVVVEKGSALNLPGVTRLEELTLLTFYIRNYFPTWYDDELNKVFEKSQETTDYLATKLPELGVEPAAKGPFKVGPNWRRSGQIQYLIMANFNDPDYNYVIKQIMAAPVRMPLTVASSRGKVAYDLLAQKEIPLAAHGKETALTVDMARIQGAMVAFLPERVARLRATVEQTANRARARVRATLVGASGQAIKGVFPTRIRFLDAKGRVEQEFYRVLGGDLSFEARLPESLANEKLTIEVREAIGGRAVSAVVAQPRPVGPVVQLVPEETPFVPYPKEVEKFMTETKRAAIVVSARVPAFRKIAEGLAASLKARGIEATIKDEQAVYHFPSGNPDQADPMNDGFHSWRGGHEIIQPATVVDEPVILMSCNRGSYLLDGLVTNGFITEAPAGGAGERVRPSIQVAPDGLHWRFDTLCLIANDAAGMARLVAWLQNGGTQAQPAAAPLGAEAPKFAEVAAPLGAEAMAGAKAMAPAAAYTGNNEQVGDIEFDKAGNVYAITWGHGNNIHSLKADGSLRFSRHLPQMGASRLDVFDDRVVSFTSAGSRLYQMTLDGKPISQMRLTLDPGPIGDEGYRLSYAPYSYLPARKQVLQNVGTMRLVDATGHVVAQWGGEKYTDKDVTDRVMTRGQHAWVFSPDRARIAQLETSRYYTRSDYQDVVVLDTHLVIRDLTGRLLGEFKNIANEREKITAELKWPGDAAGPCVLVKGEIWQFDGQLKLLYTRLYDPGTYELGGLKRLVRDGNSLRYLDGEKPEISRLGPLAVMPTYACISPDGRLIALLDESRRTSIHEAATGKRLWAFDVPQLGKVLKFSPDSKRLFVGGLRGLVMCYEPTGRLAWATSLSKYNDTLEHPVLYDPSFKDYTETLWPETHDAPGELEGMVRMGKDRLTDGGWRGEKEAPGDGRGRVRRDPAWGRTGGRCLRVGRQMVYQDVEKYLGNHVTWVLEFFYRAAPGSKSARLLAGMMVDNKYPDSVARYFAADGEWRFARVVVKSGMACKRIRVGLQGETGEALVDGVTLRQIRFPSINHTLFGPFYDIEPVILLNPLFSESYDPVGNLRQDSPSTVTVPPYTSGGKPLLEPVFLQNGRTNEISSQWYEMPPGRSNNNFPISLTLKEPRWISMVALYFNYYDIGNTTRHFDIYALDMDSKKEVRVASVRNNRQVFKLVKFPPVRTVQVKVELVNSIKRYRTVTEIELYGPLSGKEMASGFADPEGQNTYMGSFARVDKRAKTVQQVYGEAHIRRHNHGDGIMLWSVPCSQVLASEGKLYVSRSLGHNEMYTLDDVSKEKTQVRTGGIGFNPYVTLYGGLLLKCGNMGKLYCIDADSGRELWAVPVGTRPPGCPVVIDEDIYLANRAGKLYRLDLANGSVMMEVNLSAGVLGSLATDGKRLFMVSEDGFAQCYDAETGKQVWRVPVAPWTASTPAVVGVDASEGGSDPVDGGRVYVGDQKGVLRALDAASGKVVWTTDLGQEFERCPVVTADRVLAGCRDGKLAVLDRATGAVKWTIEASTRFDYEPVLMAGAAIEGGSGPVMAGEVLYFDGAKAKLADLATGKSRDLVYTWRRGRQTKTEPLVLGDDPMLSISYYKGALIFVPRHGDSGHRDQYMNYPWHVLGGQFWVLSPGPPKEKVKAKK